MGSQEPDYERDPNKGLHLILRTEEPLKSLRHRNEMTRNVFDSINPVE